MKAEDLSILKTFARKLLDCRYRVPVKTAAEHLLSGRFGYSVEENSDLVITNDIVFAEDITILLTHIRNIFKNPHLHLKKDEVVQNVSVAMHTDVESTRKTYRDDKVWKVRDGEFMPEFVHSYVYEDNYAIYENRFVVALCDLVYNTVSAKIHALTASMPTLCTLFGSENQKTERKALIDLSNENGALPVLLSSQDPVAMAIGQLIKAQKQLLSLRSRELYIACKKQPPFPLADLKETNMLLHDKEYNYCYTFFTRYLNKTPTVGTVASMYTGFITVNLFAALMDMGFSVSTENDLLVGNSALIRFENLEFTQDLFTILVNKNSPNGILLTVRCNADGNVANHRIRIECNEGDQTETETSAQEQSNVFYDFQILPDPPAEDTDVQILPSSADVLKRLQKILRSCLLVAEGASYVHTRYCPVCGSSLVSPENDDCFCPDCESLYHLFRYDAKDHIWFKRLPIAIEKRQTQFDYSDDEDD